MWMDVNIMRFSKRASNFPPFFRKNISTLKSFRNKPLHFPLAFFFSKLYNLFILFISLITLFPQCIFKLIKLIKLMPYYNEPNLQ